MLALMHQALGAHCAEIGPWMGCLRAEPPQHRCRLPRPTSHPIKANCLLTRGAGHCLGTPPQANGPPLAIDPHPKNCGHGHYPGGGENRAVKKGSTLSLTCHFCLFCGCHFLHCSPPSSRTNSTIGRHWAPLAPLLKIVGLGFVTGRHQP